MRCKRVGHGAEGNTPAPGSGQPQAAPGYGEVASEPRFDSVSSYSLPFIVKLLLYNHTNLPRSVYRFLVVFCFELFLSGSVLSFRSQWTPPTMMRGRNCRETISKTPSLRRRSRVKLKRKKKLDVHIQEPPLQALVW